MVADSLFMVVVFEPRELSEAPSTIDAYLKTQMLALVICFIINSPDYLKTNDSPSFS